MWTDEEKKQYEKDRSSLREWMKGDHEKPFIMGKREAGYCACYLLFKSFPFNVMLLFRSFIVWFAERIPFCAMKIFLYRRAGVKIGKDVYISPGVVLDPLFPELVELRDGCVLGLYAMILTHEYTAGESRIGKVIIGKNSVIGAKSVVRSGVTIGQNCTIGISSFVNKDVPDNETVAGVPARKIERKKTEL